MATWLERWKKFLFRNYNDDETVAQIIIFIIYYVVLAQLHLIMRKEVLNSKH